MAESAERVVALDLLRGTAALGVAISHYFYLTSHSPAGEALSAIFVELFFPLSGYVLANQILASVSSHSNLRIFYLRRWMRTVPPYIVALTAAAILFRASFSDWLLYATFLQDIVPSALSKAFYPIAWSLAVEEWYYLLMPLALIVGRRFGLAPLWTAVVIIVTSQLAKIAVVAIGPSDALRVYTPLRLDAIALGFLAYLLFKDLRRLTPMLIVLGASAAALVPIAMSVITGGSGIVRLLFVDLSMLLGASAVIVAARIPFPAHRAWIFVAEWLGKVSYPVYLFHLIVYAVLVIVLAGIPSLVVYLFVTLVLCLAFHLWFEKPILRARPTYLPAP